MNPGIIRSSSNILELYLECKRTVKYNKISINSNKMVNNMKINKLGVFDKLTIDG